MGSSDGESLAAATYSIYLVMLLVSFFFAYCLSNRCSSCVYLSEAGMSLLVGFIGGGILELLVHEDQSDRFAEKEVRQTVVGFSSTVLFCVLLPPIIFDSGFRMRGAFFWANIDKIMVLAFFGTLVSSLVVGAMLASASGVLPFYPDVAGNSSKISLPEALTFGALISATDPVTTLAIFEQLHVDPHLFNVIFGESVLNDAVSIVLFHSFSKAIGQEEKNVAASVLRMVWDFIVIFVGSAVIGAGLGCFSALLFKHAALSSHTDLHGPKLELSIFLVFCYAPFLLADGLGLSGIVAILFTGLVMKRYTYFNLSQSARETVATVVSMMASCAETLIFIDLGTSAWGSLGADLALLSWVLFACLVARAANVYVSGWLLNSREPSYPRRRFEANDMHMVWFAGLRGAIAFALSTQFPGPHRHCFMALAMWVVLTSVWLLGGATAPVLGALRIRRCHGDQLKQLALTLEPAVKRLAFVQLDRQYITPLLLRNERSEFSPVAGRADTELAEPAMSEMSERGEDARSPVIRPPPSSDADVEGGGAAPAPSPLHSSPLLTASAEDAE
ncbi:NHX6 [Symbiodinium sp. CCMP2592]|nr:NHX6 [Symbiodinium sp. CCMP2592]